MEMSGAYQPVLTPDEGMNPEGAAGLSPLEVQSYNFMDIKLEDCWHHILGFITEPQDLESLNAASAFFSKLLQPRKLEKLILPILMKNEFWTKETVLLTRLLNKRTKSAVDEQLMNTTPPWLSRALKCEDDEDFEDFATEFPQCSPASSSVSLLHDFTLELQSENEDGLEEMLAVLEAHGAHIRKLKLTPVWFNTDFEQVIQILSLVPNLVLLAIDLTNLAEVDNWHPPALPPLADLTELHLIPPYVHCRDYDPEYLNPVMTHLINTYGQQLRKLTCSSTDFCVIPFQTYNRKLSNLQEFHMEESQQDNDGDKQFLKLLRVNLPHLKKIVLGEPMTYHDLLSLCRYKETLEALEIEGEIIWGEVTTQEFFSLKIVLGVFPKLTHLSICTSQVDSGMWQLFKNQFVNLQDLHFRPNFQFYQISNSEDCHLKATLIPDAARRRILFEMFPKLSQFVWAHVEEKRVKRVGRRRELDAGAKTFREIVFRRPPKKVLAKEAEN